MKLLFLFQVPLIHMYLEDECMENAQGTRASSTLLDMYCMRFSQVHSFEIGFYSQDHTYIKLSVKILPLKWVTWPCDTSKVERYSIDWLGSQSSYTNSRIPGPPSHQSTYQNRRATSSAVPRHTLYFRCVRSKDQLSAALYFLLFFVGTWQAFLHEWVQSSNLSLARCDRQIPLLCFRRGLSSLILKFYLV